MSIKCYVAKNATTTAVWHGQKLSTKLKIVECAWSSDNVVYALYLARRVAAESVYGLGYKGCFYGSSTSTAYASSVSAIGNATRLMLGWSPDAFVGKYAHRGFVDNEVKGYNADYVSYTGYSSSFMTWLETNVSKFSSSSVTSGWYASLTDLDSAGFSLWGISKDYLTYGDCPSNQCYGSENATADKIWAGGSLCSYNYIADGNKVEVAEDAETITTLSTVETGGRVVALNGTNAEVCSLSTDTRLYGIADGTLTAANKKSLASDTNQYDIGAIFDGRDASTWTVSVPSGYAVTGWYNSADDTELTDTEYHYASSDKKTLTVKVADPADIDVYPKIEKTTGTATITVVGDGSVSAALNDAEEVSPFAVKTGDAVVLTLTPGTNAIASSVTANGEAVEFSNNTATVTIGYNDTDIVVTFVERALHTLTVSCTPADGGTVALTRDGETVATSASGVLTASVYDGITYALVATPGKTADGVGELKKFSGWFAEEACETSKGTDAELSLAFTDDATLWAKFDDAQGYSVTASASTLTGEAASGCQVSYTPNEGDYADGTFANKRVITFTASAGTGWDIYGWEIDGTQEEDSSVTCKVTIDGADITVKAIFKRSQYTFTASFNSASSDKGGSIVRERYDATSNAWDTLSDNDILYHGDRVRARVNCGDAGYVLGSALSNGTAVEFQRSGTAWTVTFEALANNIDLVLCMAGKLKVTLSLVTDGDATATIYNADGSTIAATANTNNGTIEAYVLLGSERRIATAKVTSDKNIGWDGWMFDGDDTPIDGLAEDCVVTMTGAEQSYKTSWSEGDKSIYVKVMNETDSASLGSLATSGGEVITKDAYASALNGFDVANDPANTIYLKLERRGTVVAAVTEVGDARFRKWTVSSVKADGTSATVSTVEKEDATLSYFCTTHSVFTAHFANDDAKRWLTVYCDGGAISFSPSGHSSRTGDNSLAAIFYTGDVVNVSVLAPSGKCFAGLFTDSAMTKAHAGTSVTITDTATLWAKLDDDTHAIFSFGAGSVNKTAHWRSKLFVATRPWSPTAMRVEADAYSRLKVRVLQASSPDKAQLDEFDERAKPLTIKDQNQRRIALRRPEKHIMVDIETDDPVSTVMVASASGGLAL